MVACLCVAMITTGDEFEIKNGSVEVKFTAIGGIGSRSSVFPGGEKVEHSNGFAVTYGTHSTQNQWPLDWRDFIVIRGYGESMDGKFLEKNKINESDSKHVGYQIEYGYPSVKVEENKEYIHAPGTIYMDDLQNIWNLLNGNTVNDNTYNGDAKHGADQVEFVDYTTRPNILNDVLRLLGKESRPITEQTNNNPNFELLVKAADGPNANATLNLFPIFANKGFYDNVGIYYYKNEGTTEEGPHNANEIILFTTDPKTPADPNAVPKTPANPEAYDDNFHHIYQEFILWNTTAEDKGMGKSYWDITVPLKMEIGL